MLVIGFVPMTQGTLCICKQKIFSKGFCLDRPIFEVFAAVPENIGRKVGTKVFVSALYASIFSSEVRPRLHLIFFRNYSMLQTYQKYIRVLPILNIYYDLMAI